LNLKTLDRTRPGFALIMQKHVAEAAIGPSSVRNQGASGVAEAARRFLAELPLDSMLATREPDFRIRLDRTTRALRRALPRGARHWGTARKVLNLFLRDALYNRLLCHRHHLQRVDKWLEVPLDGIVARGLLNRDTDGELPRWPGVKHLKSAASDEYQLFALREARFHRILRVDMDLMLWRPAGD
jgi:hypothetical protein